MRKIFFVAVVSAFCTLGGYGPALAQQIVGNWLGVGNSDLGGGYVSTLHFFANGSAQTELAAAATPQMPQGGGVVTCRGSYQYDGQILIMDMPDCNGPVVTARTGGYINFQGSNVFTWGDTTYRRQ
jgi:hypothetical protein